MRRTKRDRSPHKTRKTRKTAIQGTKTKCEDRDKDTHAWHGDKTHENKKRQDTNETKKTKEIQSTRPKQRDKT
jgi:hypothetical protein